MSTFMPMQVGVIQSDNHDSTVVVPYLVPPGVRMEAQRRNAQVAIRVLNMSAVHNIGVYTGWSNPAQFAPNVPLSLGENYEGHFLVRKGETEVFVLPSEWSPIAVLWATDLPENTKPGYRVEWGLMV